MRAGTLLLVTLIAATAVAAAQPPATRERARAPYRIGFEHLRAEAWEKAATAFQQAIDIDPSFEMAYYGLGRASLPQRKYVEAAAALAKARDLYRERGGQRFANKQEAQRYRRDQMTELDDIIRQYQSGPQTIRTQDVVRQLQDRKRDLQENMQRGNDMSIESEVPAYVSISLGSAYFRMGKLADAEREYKAAIAADPKAGEAHNNLAVVYMESGRLDEADKAVTAAEKAGFKVHPQLKKDIKDRKSAGQ